MSKIKLNMSSKAENAIFDTVNYMLLIGLCVVTLYPFINTLAISLNEALDSVRGGIYLWPREFTLYNYQAIFTQNDNLLNSAMISLLRSLVGASLSVVSCLIVAYTLSRREFVLRKFFTKFLVYTMYFNGGLIPVYLLIRSLGLINNFWVYILPMLISAYNVMVMRSYIDGLPGSLIEAAKIDGANEYKILFWIITPLSLPVIATIALFVAVSQWNSWFDTMLYCSSKLELSTLQYELQKILMSSRVVSEQMADAGDTMMNTGKSVTPTSLRAAMTIIAVVPIMFSYPFLQKYFVTGLTLGGVKG